MIRQSGLFTRLIYQAAMEVHRRIRNVEETVMIRVQKGAVKRIASEGDAADIVGKPDKGLTGRQTENGGADGDIGFEGVHENQKDRDNIDDGNNRKEQGQKQPSGSALNAALRLLRI